MLDKEKHYSEIVLDLGLGRAIVKGQDLPVRNCWHFYTSGDSVEVLFRSEEDFSDGLNRILPVVTRYDILILAFVLMDSHVHFVLYGKFESCNRFIHDYIKLTSMYISYKYQEKNTLRSIQISHQTISDDRYLKTVICYVVKNPLTAGLPYMPWDYPWGSGSLYFRVNGTWSSPWWMIDSGIMTDKIRDIRKLTRSKVKIDEGISTINKVIVPAQYVSVDIVEQLFRSHKAYHYFLSTIKEIDVESQGGVISKLSVPLIEMRENRRRLSEELFGVTELRNLNMEQRLRLARYLKSRYNCSPKQISKVCGLVYDEVKDLL